MAVGQPQTGSVKPCAPFSIREGPGACLGSFFDNGALLDVSLCPGGPGQLGKAEGKQQVGRFWVSALQGLGFPIPESCPCDPSIPSSV